MQPRKGFSEWAGRNTFDHFNLHRILVQRGHCITHTHLQNALKYRSRGFPGGTAVKNQPAREKPVGESESCSVVADSLRPHEFSMEFSGQNTGVGSLSLLQGIFLTQGWNPGPPHCRRIPYQLSQQKSPARGHRFSRGSGKIPQASGQRGPCSTTTEPVLQNPGAASTEAWAPWNLRSAAREAPAMRSPPRR